MTPTVLFNPSSIVGTSLVNFVIDTQVTVAALGLPTGATVTFEIVQLSSPSRDQLRPGCCEVPVDKLSNELSWQPLMCCEGQPVRVNNANPYIVLDAPQHVRLRAVVTGYDFSAAPFPGEIIVYPSTSTITNDVMRGCCPDPVAIVPAPPVTATVSPCPVPVCFTWGGETYNSIVAFANDIKSLVSGATYNVATCTFSAPAGSVFPPLMVVACAPVVVPPTPPVYCPSLRMDVCGCGTDIGFAYRNGDSIDPAATVDILACDGATIGYAYPSAGVGHTVAYEDNGVVVGYLQNRSACAPEVSPVTNVYTTVAAPTVVLPAPTVASQVLDANDAIITTMTDGTVFTTPLSNC